MDYLVVVEKGEKGYGAWVPDLPGCVAAASNRRETLKLTTNSSGRLDSVGVRSLR